MKCACVQQKKQGTGLACTCFFFVIHMEEGRESEQIVFLSIVMQVFLRFRASISLWRSAIGSGCFVYYNENTYSLGKFMEKSRCKAGGNDKNSDISIGEYR